MLVLLSIYLPSFWLNPDVNFSVRNYGNSTLLFAVMGASGSLICIALCSLLDSLNSRLVRGLCYIGRNCTTTILLMHMWVYRILHQLEAKVGVANNEVVQYANVVVILAVCIGINWLIEKVSGYIVLLRRGKRTADGDGSMI